MTGPRFSQCGKRRRFPLPVILASGALVLLGAAGNFAAFAAGGMGGEEKPLAVTPAQAAFFETKVRPLLFAHCLPCHGDKMQAAGLRLDSRAALLKGTAAGPAAVVGDPEHSRLIRVVHYDGDIKMPPGGKLKPQEIATLTEWVKTGMPWPGVKANPDTPAASASDYVITPAQRAFWAFRPVKKRTPPLVKNKAWVKSPIDAFVLARLEAKGLAPAPPADKRTLLRRAYFDLIGLPPTSAQMEAFLRDTKPGAFARVVDALLASPHYGERWGRHWLDVARYADSNGQDENLAFGTAFRYRDYVIAAFNKDKPYNQFVCEQLAGDLMPTQEETLRNERLTATGFLALGPKVLAEQDKPKLVMDIVDEQIEVTSKVFLGLTVACARCHNHKFDPIPTRDYYALAGIFKSTRVMQDLGFVSHVYERPLTTKALAADIAAHEKQTQAAQSALKTLTDKANALLVAELKASGEKYLQAGWTLAQQPPPAKSEQAALPEAKESTRADGLNAALVTYFAERLHGVADLDAARKLLTDGKVDGDKPGLLALPDKPKRFYPAAVQLETAKAQKAVEDSQSATPAMPLALAAEEGSIEDVKIHIRGSTQMLGEVAPRRFLAILGGDKMPPIDGKRSGRLELAQWLTRPENPLTARVAVNRIWLNHFGAGLVRTPDNWGVMGEKPTHPELLDWLAATFVADGWSFKQMHRRILLSNTYQMSSGDNPRAQTLDPENRLLWRANRQRLDAEAFRDALLAVSGKLDATMGGTLLPTGDNDYVTTDQSGNAAQYSSPRRSVYLPVIRNALFDEFQAFDFADPNTTHAQRTATTVAPQALYVMNSPFVETAAQEFARRLDTMAKTDAERLRAAYPEAFGRQPTPAEISRALTFLARYEARLAPAEPDMVKRHAMAWKSLCQILFAANEFIYLN